MFAPCLLVCRDLVGGRHAGSSGRITVRNCQLRRRLYRESWTLLWAPRWIFWSARKPEPAFDLVDPGEAGRGEVHVEAVVAGQPCFDRGGLVGAVVVADQVDVGGHGLIDGDQELLNSVARCWRVQFADHGSLVDLAHNLDTVTDIPEEQACSRIEAKPLPYSPYFACSRNVILESPSNSAKSSYLGIG
jgi:hypothetical protein